MKSAQENLKKADANVIQKVKILPVKNKDQNVSAVFLISIENLLQARKRDCDSTNFT